MSQSMTEVLRRELERAPSRYRVAVDTGIAESVLSRFLHGADLRLSNADRLAGYLGLELRARKGRKKPKRSTR